jgi:hypothetical protein
MTNRLAPDPKPQARPAAPSINGDNGTPGSRNADGTFARGNKGGPGNPFHRRVCELRREFLAAVSPPDMRQLAARLLERALAGDNEAARLLLEHVLGKPGRVPNPDAESLDEWRLLAARPSSAAFLRVLADTFSPDLAGAFVRALGGQSAELARMREVVATAAREATVGGGSLTGRLSDEIQAHVGKSS